MNSSSYTLSQINFDIPAFNNRAQLLFEKGCTSQIQFPNTINFPSFHFPNNFCMQQARPMIIPTTQSPNFATTEIRKKIKLNDKSERFLQSHTSTNFSQTIREEQAKEFGIPELLSKQNTSSKRQYAGSINKVKPFNPEEMRKDKEGSLVMTDPAVEALKGFYNKELESIQDNLEFQKRLHFHREIRKKVANYARWLTSVKNKVQVYLDTKVDNAESRTAINNLKEEFIERHISRNIVPLLKIGKKNQEQIAAYLKKSQISGLQKRENSIEFVLKDTFYSDTNTEAIKREVKEEFLH